MKPLCITGVGVVSTLGVGWDAWTKALGDPKAAAADAFRDTSEVLDAEKFGPTRTAEVWGWDPKQWLGAKGHRNFDRLTKFLITAAKDALNNSGIKSNDEFAAYEAHRIGISSATAYGSLDAITELKRVSELEEPRYINPTRFPNTVINAAAGYVSIWEGMKGPNTTVVDGNCGSLDAVLNGETHLSHNRADAFLVGGGEVVSEALYIAMLKLGLVGTGTGTDPATATGTMSMGEGACYLAIEREQDAAKRGAHIHGKIRGYGTSFEAPEREALIVHSSADAAARAIQQALSEAGLQPDDVDLVCSAHAGVPDIDQPELVGIHKALGTDVAVVAPKQIIGETFGAAGAFGLAAALAWLQGSPLPTLVAGKAPTKLDHIVVNAVGFYGNVSCVILSRA